MAFAAHSDVGLFQSVENGLDALEISRARGVSPQTAPNSRKAQKDHSLTFPVLSDPGNEIANRFGVRFRLPDDVVGLYRQFGIDLEAVNGEASHTLPTPARYIVGRNGVIAYAEVNPDYSRRAEPEELMPALRSLGQNQTLNGLTATRAGGSK